MEPFDCESINNVVVVGAVEKHSRVMKVERPLVTPAACCERTPLRARAVSPAGITTQRWSSGFRALLRPGVGTALPLCGWACGAKREADRHPGGSAGPLDPTVLRRGQRQALRPKIDRGRPTDCRLAFFLFLSAELEFASRPQPTGSPLNWPQRQILCINDVAMRP